jgi:outer membrane protein OmpA-like peptidoglycan-associated protein/outer membrane protein W
MRWFGVPLAAALLLPAAGFAQDDVSSAAIDEQDTVYAQAAPARPAGAAATSVQEQLKFMVFFDWDKATLTPQARQVVAQAADEFRRTGAARLVATGYTDLSGSPQYNLELSQRRADAVKAELVRLGVPANVIATIGRGEADPLVPTADGVREPQNRRVTIEFAAPPKQPPAPVAAAPAPEPAKAVKKGYQSGDLLIQGLATGFYTGASGNVGQGTGLDYDSGSMTANPALNITYFFTPNIAAQTVLAVPKAKVDVSNGTDENLTSQYALPLSIIGQYHFFSEAMVSPFIGAGLTRLWLWEDDSDNKFGKVDVDNTWGGLVNFGLNFKIPNSRWVAVLDAKKWWTKSTNAHIDNNKVGNVTLNPWFFGGGIGYNFSTPPLF